MDRQPASSSAAAAADRKDPPSARGTGRGEKGERAASGSRSKGSLAAGETPADSEAVATRTATDTFMPADTHTSDGRASVVPDLPMWPPPRA